MRRGGSGRVRRVLDVLLYLVLAGLAVYLFWFMAGDVEVGLDLIWSGVLGLYGMLPGHIRLLVYGVGVLLLIVVLGALHNIHSLLRGGGQ